MESVGRLAGGIAHDFNNMLSVILGHANLLLEEGQAAHDTQAALTEIRLAAERSAALTRQLLGFSRQQPVVPQVLDLDATVAGQLTMLRRLIGEAIELSWHPSSTAPRVRIDPGQITQVLTNLCLNARDAIGGGGRIDVATSRTELDAAACRGRAGLVPGTYVALTVRDTGVGMPPHVLSHIFEPFFTTKALGQGTGLGLATVYGIARQNGGWVDVESEPGGGTLFRLLLPALPDVPTAGPEVVEHEEVPAGRGETILLVEDELALLGVAERLLRGLGYRVLATDRPDDALQLAAQHEGLIDLLVTDVVMAGMSGRELMAQLCTRRPDLPCLYVSGYTADIISAHGVLHDGVQFLAKPYTRGDLARRVRELLDSPRAPHDSNPT
jgi:CheY-like chemotaxis protein